MVDCAVIFLFFSVTAPWRQCCLPSTVVRSAPMVAETGCMRAGMWQRRGWHRVQQIGLRADAICG